MSIHRIAASQVLHRLHEYSAIIDTRSPGEFDKDRLPGAVNWPSLSNTERAQIGLLHRQAGAFEARKRGAALVARNIAAHITAHAQHMPRHWRPLVYCWRGGQRSAALAVVLAQIGFAVDVVEGGYKAFRKAILADLPHQAKRLHYQVLCGPTGSGKTRLLHALAHAGAQVLDLEAIAHHRASVLGAIPRDPQPTQKHFDTQVWQALRQFDASRPVFVEAESKRIGSVTVPPALVAAMRASPCLRLDLPLDRRVALLLEDYPYWATHPEHFCSRLDALASVQSWATVNRWKADVQAGRIAQVVRELLERHYDPAYAQSTRRDFSQFGDAAPLPLAHGFGSEMTRLATHLLHADPQPSRS